MTSVIGISSVGVGFRLILKPRLRLFVIAPLLTSFVTISALLAIGFSFVQDAVAWAMAGIPEVLSFIEVVLAPLFYLVGLLAGGWLFGFAAIIIASPFLGVLAARAEIEAFGSGPSSGSTLTETLSSAFRRELHKFVFHAPRLLLALGLGLVLSPLAPLIWYLFGAWLVAIQFIDFAAENRELPFASTLTLARRNRAAVFAFGAITAPLLSIPFLNVVIIPAAVCGGAILWRRITNTEIDTNSTNRNRQ